MNKDSTKEKIEIMQAWIEGCTIQVTDKDYHDWEDIRRCHEHHWNFEANDYRIKPKQKVKKTIKYLCFEHKQGTLYFVAENSIGHGNTLKSHEFIRIHEFDKTREIEVEE